MIFRVIRQPLNPGAVLFTFIICFFCRSTVQAEDKKYLICFHEIDTIGKRDHTRFSLEKFDTQLCTHLVYSLIRLEIETNEVKYSDILKEGDKNDKLIVSMKAKNPRLKILVILNLDQHFWTDSYTEILANTSHVDETARKVVAVLDQHKFDGIYFEFVSSHDVKSGFMNLIKSLKKAFLAKGHILAYVGNNNEDEIDQGYDIPELRQNLDMLILETYNFHDATIEPKSADHHAPLRNRPWDTENKTVDSLVNLWINKGFPANKILLTIPLWGNSWKLSTNKTNPPAPANGKGAPGRLTSRSGILGYFEICHKILSENNWQVFPSDNQTMGPYAVSSADSGQNRTWVGYDDPAMAVVKSKYILSKGLGGAVVKEISYDEIHNGCGGGHYPMLNAIRTTLSPGWNNPSSPKLKNGNVNLMTPNHASIASSIYPLLFHHFIFSNLITYSASF